MRVRKVVSLILCIVFVFTFAGTALAKNSSGDRQILLNKNGNKVIVPGPNVTDKALYNPNPEGQGSPKILSSPASLSDSYDKSITPPGGSSGRILNSFC
ncbi:hypothetical protein L9W92_12100 [Pelotomaculum terephthalicicum JT]|uniref:hypothetical protein n=1 Tax=Pelotomaculum terephthalicicum TaxID=206393 RepID=UPI001F03E345|nr:hypothetical protein [Pelotomaculum terephthalicicum]MCG9968782.1 hypothetical protein [Pelotomaculum terephthalicicum JT]